MHLSLTALISIEYFAFKKKKSIIAKGLQTGIESSFNFWNWKKKYG